MLRLFMNCFLFWSQDITELNEEYAIYSLKTSENINEISTMEFTILETHPRYSELNPGRSLFLLTNDTKGLFLGKMAGMQKNMNKTVTVTVESLLSVLKDSSYEYQGTVSWETDNTKTFSNKVVTYGDFINDTLKLLKGGFPERSIENMINGRSIVDSDGKTYNFNSEYYCTDISVTSWFNIALSENVSDIDSETNITLDDFAGRKTYWEILFDKFFEERDCIVDLEIGTCQMSKVSSSAIPIHNRYRCPMQGPNYRIQVKLSIYNDPYMLSDNSASKNLTVDPTNFTIRSLVIGGDDPPHTLIDNPPHTPPIGGTFVFGQNIFDLSVEPFIDDMVSGIYLKGTDSEGTPFIMYTGSGSNAKKKIINKTLVGKIGIKLKEIDFGSVPRIYYGYNNVNDKITSSNEIWQKATSWANKHLVDYGDKYTITGIDNYWLDDKLFYRCAIYENEYYIDDEIDETVMDDIYTVPLGLNITSVGSYVKIISQPHKLYVAGTCLSKEIDYFNHTNDKYIIGPYIKDNVYDYKLSNT